MTDYDDRLIDALLDLDLALGNIETEMNIVILPNDTMGLYTDDDIPSTFRGACTTETMRHAYATVGGWGADPTPSADETELYHRPVYESMPHAFEPTYEGEPRERCSAGWLLSAKLRQLVCTQGAYRLLNALETALEEVGDCLTDLETDLAENEDCPTDEIETVLKEIEDGITTEVTESPVVEPSNSTFNRTGDPTSTRFGYARVFDVSQTEPLPRSTR